MSGLKPVSDLTDHLGFWLRLVSNQVSHGFAARLEAQGVTVAEWVMLRALYGQAPEAPSRLAETMGMTRGAITKLADRLISKGFVIRRPSAEDARAQTLALTRAGTQIVPDLAALADANDAGFFAALGKPERRALEKTLQKLAAAYGKTPLPLE